MKLVVADLAVARRHGLDALAISRANQPRNDTDRSQAHTLAHHQPENVAPLRSQRKAHADVVRSLGNQIRHHAIHAHHRQNQGEDTERTQHDGGEALPRKGVVHAVLHGLNIVHGPAAINRMKFADQGAGGNRGIGLEVCRQLAARGIRTVLTARSADKGQPAAAKLAAQGHSVYFYEPLEGGHAGASDNVALAFNLALSSAFLRKTIVVDMASPGSV